MIEVKDVTVRFGEKTVLSHVSATFERGKTSLVIGRSGSGKTVLLKSIVGLVTVTEGEIIYDDAVFNKLDFTGQKDIRKEIGMIFQGSALFDSLNVEKNVMFPLDMFTDMTIGEKRDRVNFCLHRVNLDKVNKLSPAELSGGMKKRVAIARAIALNPKYLLCDEPNSGLDPQTSIVIDNLIREITEEYNMTTIINTHDMNSVLEIGDKVTFIYEGHVEWEGTKNDILHSHNKYLDDFVFASELGKKIKASAVKVKSDEQKTKSEA
ncbi:MAG: ATP-binding cassette domain-containing protein [Bacteroidales bacterium]|jgi:phospholipid/cholesterol/gamma-HCH transport system ATP-binding protein|nr:ATP-binding cassette domain-containing protein [Bacteroidales bacterium]